MNRTLKRTGGFENGQAVIPGIWEHGSSLPVTIITPPPGNHGGQNDKTPQIHRNSQKVTVQIDRTNVTPPISKIEPPQKKMCLTPVSGSVDLPFNFTGSSPINESWMDNRVSIEQMTVINKFVAALNGLLQPGDVITSANFTQRAWGPPYSPIFFDHPYAIFELGAFGFSTLPIDPATGLRIDDISKYGGTPVMAPPTGIGNPVITHFQSQTRLMVGLLTSKIGVSIMPNTIWSHPSPRYRFNGTYRRPITRLVWRPCPN